MNLLNLMYVAFGGAVGSMLRFMVVSLVGHNTNTTFPVGTFTVNILGGFMLGALIAALALLVPAKGKDLHLLLAVGLLGGFTTFSAFSMDTYMLMERGLYIQAFLYVFGSVLVSVLALIAGMWLVRLAAG